MLRLAFCWRFFCRDSFFFQYYGNNVATLPQFFPKLCLDFIIIIIIILIARRPAAVELLPFEVVCRLVVVSSNIRAQLFLCSLIAVHAAATKFTNSSVLLYMVFYLFYYSSNLSVTKKNSIIKIRTRTYKNTKKKSTYFVIHRSTKIFSFYCWRGRLTSSYKWNTYIQRF